MAEISPESQRSSTTPGRRPRCMEDEEIEAAAPDVHNTAKKSQRAKEVYKAYAELQEKPTKLEVLAWYLYGLCSYFIHTVLIPIVFPLIISQIVKVPQDAMQGLEKRLEDMNCRPEEIQLYEKLVYRSIKVNSLKISPLEWTSISWVAGLLIAAPILVNISIHLDHGQNQQQIMAAATAIGALFCLPAGFFKTIRIFPPYIAIIVAANTICSASHTRHLGLMVHGFIGSTIRKSQFPDRRALIGWLSLYSTAAGCLGSAIMSAFTYRMLGDNERFTSLWVVSIFSGFTWFVGIAHTFASNRTGPNPTSSPNSIPKSHIISIFNYPHASGSVVGVFFSSFATMCIFAGGLLNLVGQFCFKPVSILRLSLTYFILPLIFLPIIQPLQQLIKADAVRMQLLGFLLSMLTSGVGYYYRNQNWHKDLVLFFAAVQSISAGLLHAFGRVLLMDCSPAGKEGAFSAWFSWVRTLGTCAGFVLASTGHGSIIRSFGVAFCSSIVGIVVLIFGNVSNFGGAKAAGHVKEESEKGSPVRGLDTGVEMKAPVDVKPTPDEEKAQV